VVIADVDPDASPALVLPDEDDFVVASPVLPQVAAAHEVVAAHEAVAADGETDQDLRVLDYFDYDDQAEHETEAVLQDFYNVQAEVADDIPVLVRVCCDCVEC
jgi:hypothetical protein